VRPEVKDAIKTARGAGITPIMITGDHKLTAMAIARELDMLGEDNLAIEGAELEEMSDEKFKELLPKIAVYARVQPEHKTRIVSAWQERNKVTAMTGDGVNDAPSIKKADIGIGMGITGTDVTKNVADMVLTDDNFATIVKAVAEGRHIYDNIRKAIIFLLGSNLSEVISIFVATLAGFIILRPVHLLWINLVTDSFPALALGVENSEADIMNRPPRKADEGLFSGGVGFAVAYQGLTIAVLTLLSYFMGHYMDTGVFEIAASEHGITMAFLTLSFSEIFHSFNMRDLKRSIFQIKDINKSLLLAAVASILSTTAVCEIPFLSELFGIVPVSWAQYGVAAGIAFLIIPIVETVKFIKRATEKPASA
jgi:Ca2+-transporting ATPase